jgi:hypothetical protein
MSTFKGQSNQREHKRLAHLKGYVTHQSEAVGQLVDPGDMVIVKRGAIRSLVMRCPDGCGDLLTINLDPRSGRAWRLYHDEEGTTLYPSVWRDTGCGAHFVLWDDSIFWIDDLWPKRKNLVLEKRVLDVLTVDFLPFATIAEELEEVPWEVLTACRSLVSQNLVEEGRKDFRSCFRRSTIER